METVRKNVDGLKYIEVGKASAKRIFNTGDWAYDDISHEQSVKAMLKENQSFRFFSDGTVYGMNGNTGTDIAPDSIFGNGNPEKQEKLFYKMLDESGIRYKEEKE